MSSILEKILENKRIEVELAKKSSDLSQLAIPDSVTPFLERFEKNRLAIIAEVKKASPSKGLICQNFNPIEIAKIYAEVGVNAISILTEEKYFLGHLDYLKQIAQATSIPLLRKDFVVDSFQIEEAYYAGASAILLIVAALTAQELTDFIIKANDLQLTALVEVHDKNEVKIALDAGAHLIGINNRNLNTFQTDIKQTENLLPFIPHKNVVISESGIETVEDIKYLQSLGIHGVLIGEAFMKAQNIRKKVKQFIL